MTKFRTSFVAVGGGIQEIDVEADRFSVGLSGCLEFWRVTSHGDALIRAIAPGRWVNCEEVDA